MKFFFYICWQYQHFRCQFERRRAVRAPLSVGIVVLRQDIVDNEHKFANTFQDFMLKVNAADSILVLRHAFGYLQLSSWPAMHYA